MNKLDTMWKYTQKYTKQEIDEDEFIEISGFKKLDYDDQRFFAITIKRMKCVKSFGKIAQIVMDSYLHQYRTKIMNFCKTMNVPIPEIKIADVSTLVKKNIFSNSRRTIQQSNMFYL